MTANHDPRSYTVKTFLPWTDGTGKRWRGWKLLPLTIPFVIIYNIVAWVVFVPAAEKRGRHYWIDDDAVGHLLFQIPSLTADPRQAVLSIVTGPWINHDSLQLIYVTALLLLFGAVFEVREGTIRLMLIFFSTSFVAALFSGFLLHLIYPHISLFVAWECFIWWVNLRNYTSVFHFSAMATGFAITCWWLPPIRGRRK
jgi:hypothetical protein